MPIKNSNKQKNNNKDQQLLTKYYKLEKELYQKKLLSLTDLSFPSFMCIGAQKAGTTWLYANLKKHPEIKLARKEYHYFDKDAKFYTPLKNYCKYFKSRNNKISGDITPSYSVLEKDRIKLIKTLMPNLRLIFIMRNPIDRALSAASMRFSKKMKKDINSVSDKDFIDFLSMPGVIKRGRYLQTLENFLTYFNKEQLHIEFYENIKNEPEKLIKRIFSHIQVNPKIDLKGFPLKKVIHKGKNEKFIPHQGVTNFLEETFRDDIDQLKEKFGDVIAHW
jgi:hypothetical protein